MSTGETLMAIYSWRTSTYARNIYLLGVTSLDTIPVDYYIPVEQYAATNVNYGINVINNAFAQGWITQEQYNETIAYIV